MAPGHDGMSQADAKHELSRLADLPAAAIDLAETALLLAALHHPRRDRHRYRVLLAEMTAVVADRGAAAETVGDRVTALTDTLTGRYRLLGDDDDDGPDGASIMELLDRRRGPPCVLGLVWLHLGRRLGWAVEALAFPGRLLLRFADDNGQRLIVDPSAGGRCLDPAALRELLKLSAGAAAELEPAHYASLTNREVLVRLQTSVKLHYLRHAQIERAAETAEATLLFAPDELGLWREVGLMHLRQGNLPHAVAALEQFVARSPNTASRHRTSALLQELRQKLT